jgi:hypothetical protein
MSFPFTTTVIAVPGFKSDMLATLTKLGIYASSIVDEEFHPF